MALIVSTTQRGRPVENWVSLHTHTNYSILDGLSKIPELVSRAVELEMPAVGISDHGNLYGALPFFKECLQQGIKPIIGMEVYVAPNGASHKSPWFYSGRKVPGDVSGNGGYTHMLLVATSGSGLRELYKLHSRGFSEGFYGKPRIDLGMLAEATHAAPDGIIGTTGCRGGAIPTLIDLDFPDEKIHEEIRSLEDVLGGDNLFFEVMHHGLPFNAKINGWLYNYDLARTVATNDSHYTYSNEHDIHDSVLALQTQSKKDDPKRFRFNGVGYHLRSYAEMADSGLPKVSLQNTLAVADRVDGSYAGMFNKRDRMPTRMPDMLALRDLVYSGLEAHTPTEYLDRVEYELSIIESMGFDDYFVILSDIVNWGKSQGISFGPGRGSAAGSLVAYLLGITEIDPIKWGLIFERFLNPNRVTPPDIDIDIEPERRDELLRYAQQKYGHDRVAQVITFGYVKSRAAIRDAARVLGYSPSVGDQITSTLPRMTQGRSAPLSDSPEIADAHPDIYELALALEGNIRNVGVHAAGVVISPEDLSGLAPMSASKKGILPILGIKGEDVGAVGLNKLDFLALDTLTLIKEVKELIREKTD